MRKHLQHSSIVVKTAFSVTAVFLIAIFFMLFGITYLNSYWMRQRILTDKQEFVSEIARELDDQLKNITTPLVSLGNQSSVYSLLTAENGYDYNWLSDTWEMRNAARQFQVYYDYLIDLILIDTDSR